MRQTVGLMFLFYGIDKFMGGLTNSAEGIIKGFEHRLPTILVTAFAYTLPFAEVLIGALLFLGLFTRISLILAGLLMMALTFGVVISGQSGIVANNVGYAFIIFVLAYLVDNNRYSIDTLIRRRWPALSI
jgi:thiosulfate dehydrogenase [quinone] large subunit